MHNSDLERLLKSAPDADRSPEFWEQLPGRISAKIHWREKRVAVSEATSRRPTFRVAWALSGAVALLLIGFAVGNWRGTKRADGLLRNEKLVREVLTLFPNQVRAIIQDENGLRLALSEKPDVPKSTPLWIKVCDGERCRSFVTFSGQSVQIAGERVEVLADARGGVMLMGERFIWSSHESAARDHLRIDALPLGQVL